MRVFTDWQQDIPPFVEHHWDRMIEEYCTHHGRQLDQDDEQSSSDLLKIAQVVITRGCVCVFVCVCVCVCVCVRERERKRVCEAYCTDLCARVQTYVTISHEYVRWRHNSACFIARNKKNYRRAAASVILCDAPKWQKTPKQRALCHMRYSRKFPSLHNLVRSTCAHTQDVERLRQDSPNDSSFHKWLVYVIAALEQGVCVCCCRVCARTHKL